MLAGVSAVPVGEEEESLRAEQAHSRTAGAQEGWAGRDLWRWSSPALAYRRVTQGSWRVEEPEESERWEQEEYWS